MPKRTKRVDKHTVETVSQERVDIEARVEQTQKDIEDKALVPAPATEYNPGIGPRNELGMRVSDTSREAAKQRATRAGALIDQALEIAESTDLDPSQGNNFQRLFKATLANSTHASEKNLAPQARALEVVTNVLGLENAHKQVEQQQNAVAQIVINMPVLVHPEFVREEDSSFAPGSSPKRPSWATDAPPVVDAEIVESSDYKRKA
jgi:hypothetical protein